MNIIWNQNPLKTVVELSEADETVLMLKIQLEDYEDRMFTAHYALEKDPPNVTEALSELDPDKWCGDDTTQIAVRVRHLFAIYRDELSMSHCGDCTCVPMSCMKCHAEGLLGITTLPKLSKYVGHRIDQEFRKHETLDAVIQSLENYQDPKFADFPGWEKLGHEAFQSHFGRWKTEAEHALIWLRNYRDEHFTPPIIIQH